MATVTLEDYEKRHIFGNNRPFRMIFVSILGFNKISDRLEYVSLRLGIEIMLKTEFAPLRRVVFVILYVFSYEWWIRRENYV